MNYVNLGAVLPPSLMVFFIFILGRYVRAQKIMLHTFLSNTQSWINSFGQQRQRCDSKSRWHTTDMSQICWAISWVASATCQHCLPQQKSCIMMNVPNCLKNARMNGCVGAKRIIEYARWSFTPHTNSSQDCAYIWKPLNRSCKFVSKFVKPNNTSSTLCFMYQPYKMPLNTEFVFINRAFEWRLDGFYWQ